MAKALEMALAAQEKDEVPVGAIIADYQGKIVASAYNLKESTSNPCAHAEILAIEQACQTLNTWRLNGYVLYVTLEPCLMCMAAISQARLDGVIFGAYDEKFGGGSNYQNPLFQKKLNHHFSIMGGINQQACAKLLKEFFKKKRIKQK